MIKLLYAESHPLHSATTSELFRTVLSEATLTVVQSFKQLTQAMAGESFDWLVAEIQLKDVEPSECVDFLLTLKHAPRVAVLTSTPTESALLDQLRSHGIVVMHKSDSFAQTMQTVCRCFEVPLGGALGQQESLRAPG